MDSKEQADVQAYLLKECYTLAAQHELDETAREVLSARAKNLGLASAPYEQMTARIPVTVQSRASDVYQALISAHDSAQSMADAVTYFSDVPHSAEQEFLLAIIALGAGRKETQRINAMEHIRKALQAAPHDPRIRALAAILEEAGG